MQGIRLSLLTLIAVAIVNVPPVNASESEVAVSDIAWLAGNWEGIGDDGKETGNAYSVWTKPVEGVMSWTFRWHQVDEEHVHFAFSIIEETEEGVLLRGIHHGRDFEAFEDVNWTMRLTEASKSFARFECVMNCRATSVEFALLPDGVLTESWRSTAGEEPGFVISYHSSGMD